jgi:hypothetical protein
MRDEGNVLDEYRKQANELAAALAQAKSIQEQTASVTLARETAIGQRQKLLNDWRETQDEDAVTELSKLSARAEVFAAKLAAQEAKLTAAEAELRCALAGFGISFNAIFLMLKTFLKNEAISRVAEMVHPKARASSADAIAQVAEVSIEVMDLAPLQIHLEPGASDFNNVLALANLQQAAERSLPKAEALLLEAAKHDGFIPPLAFSMATWRTPKPVAAA